MILRDGTAHRLPVGLCTPKTVFEPGSLANFPTNPLIQFVSHHFGYEDAMESCAKGLAKVKVNKPPCSPSSTEPALLSQRPARNNLCLGTLCWLFPIAVILVSWKCFPAGFAPSPSRGAAGETNCSVLLWILLLAQTTAGCHICFFPVISITVTFRR